MDSTQRDRIRKYRLLAVVVGSLPILAKAAVNDVLPADYVSLPTGTTTMALYALERNYSGPYSAGRKVLDGSFDNQVVALRFTQVMEIAGLKVSPLAVLSWSRLDFEPFALQRALAPEAAGYGDLRLGSTAWLVEDTQGGHFLGVSGILSLPTGTYHATQPINIGENRYRFVLGAGWVHPLVVRDLLFEISPEIAWYGDNDRYLGHHRLTQDTSYALTSYLRYRSTQPWQVHVGWQGNWGGSTRIDDVGQNNVPANQRWMAGLTWNADHHNHLIFRWGQDYKADNGFKLDREVALRWLLMW